MTCDVTSDITVAFIPCVGHYRTFIFFPCFLQDTRHLKVFPLKRLVDVRTALDKSFQD